MDTKNNDTGKINRFSINWDEPLILSDAHSFEQTGTDRKVEPVNETKLLSRVVTTIEENQKVEPANNNPEPAVTILKFISQGDK